MNVARAYVGLGGNLGDARAHIDRACGALAALPGTTLAARSRDYRSPAWGPVVQPDYINAVAALDTMLGPLELLDALLAIERDAGRDRVSGLRWGPRTLDLDLLLHGDTVLDAPGLHVPHPRLHERAFVVVPLLEVAPQLVIPGHGPLREIAARVGSAAIEALP